MAVELMGLQVLALHPMEQTFLPKEEFCEGVVILQTMYGQKKNSLHLVINKYKFLLS